MSDVRFEHVIKNYGSVVAANDIHLTITDGEFFSLLGPSGSGKTTVLRLIAGFIQPDSGAIWIGDREMSGQPPEKRGIGMVFQNYALFPHLSVAENVAFGLSVRHEPKDQIDQRVKEALELVELGGFGSRLPKQLSGGQQQRVALARALITRPRVLLLDEPLGALDKKLRTQMQVELRQLQQELKITAIFVTHDQEEALTLSDRIAVMDKGAICQIGAPQEVYEKPATHFVSNFLGQSNFFDGRLEDCDHGAATVMTTAGPLQSLWPRGRQVGETVTLVVRPEKVKITRQAPVDMNSIGVQVVHRVYMGTSTTYLLQPASGDAIIAFAQNEASEPAFAMNDQVFATWSPENCFLLED